MQKVKKAVNLFNPFKGGKVNWFLLILYVGSATITGLQKFGVIDLELYEKLIAVLQLLGLH